MRPPAPTFPRPKAPAARAFACLLSAALCLCASPAFAADPVAQARELFLQGQKALDAGKSKEALAAFEAAYQNGKAPSLLFYLAEANRQAGNNGKALELYQEYLAKLPAAPKKADAEARIAELKKGAPKKEAKRKVELDDFDLEVAKPAAAPKKLELEEFSLDAASPGAAKGAAAKDPAKEAKAQARAEARAKAKAAREAKAAEAKAAEEQRAAEAQAAEQDKAAEAQALAEKKGAEAKAAEERKAAKKAAAEAKLAAKSAAAAVPPAPVAPAPVAAAPVAAAPAPAEAKPAVPPAAAAPAAAPKTVAVAEAPAAKRPLPPAPGPALASARPSGSGMRTAAWVFGGVGVAALVGGGLFGLQAHSASNDMTQAARGGLTFDPAVEDRGKRAQTLQYVCLGAGGAALLGAGLLALFAPSESDSRALLLVPATVPGGAMATLGLRY